MDISIEKAALHSPYIIVNRLVDGQVWIERAPKEILAIRAAEYDLEPDDDFVLDLVLLEPFMVTVEAPGTVHPLFRCDTVADALEEMHARVGEAQEVHGAPKGKNRAMAAAVRNGAASAGLLEVHHRYHKYADPRVRGPVQTLRDAERDRLRNVTPKARSLADRLAEQAQNLAEPPRTQ